MPGAGLWVARLRGQSGAFRQDGPGRRCGDLGERSGRSGARSRGIVDASLEGNAPDGSGKAGHGVGNDGREDLVLFFDGFACWMSKLPRGTTWLGYESYIFLSFNQHII